MLDKNQSDALVKIKERVSKSRVNLQALDILTNRTKTIEIGNLINDLTEIARKVDKLHDDLNEGK